MECLWNQILIDNPRNRVLFLSDYLYNVSIMSRKKEKRDSFLNPETKNSIVAVFLIGVAAILLLAAFGKAGPAGEFAHTILKNLFGWGSYNLWLSFPECRVLELLL